MPDAFEPVTKALMPEVALLNFAPSAMLAERSSKR